MTMIGIGEKALCSLFCAYAIKRIFGLQIGFIIFVIVIAVQLFIWYRAATLWKRLGIPSPPSWILIGNMWDYATKGFHNCDVEWMKKYGNMYGCYMFTAPELVVADPEILRLVLVKDFHNFTNRREFEIGNEKSVFRRMVTVLKDDEWKNTRNAITPAFTSGKLKNTMHLMEKCISTCCSILQERSQDVHPEVDVKNMASNLTLDIIAAAAFALDTDSQRNPDNEFMKYAQQLTNFSFGNWRLIITILFPWTLGKLDQHFGIQILMPGMEEFYVGYLSQVLKERRKSPKLDKLDFLQLMINAADQQNYHADIDTSIDHGINAAKKWHISDFDIIAQSFIFLLAGQETVASTLNFVLYSLTMHTNVQQKCLEEISAVVGDDQTITYHHMQQDTPYLDAVINETLRLYPPVARFDRHTEHDYYVSDQLVIPAGTAVCVPAYAIQHSPENYEDPEKFDPERFLIPEKKNDNPFAYLPFGYGPRNCIGMRFAQLEMKMIVSNLIRKFRIEPCEDTPPMPLELDFSTSSLKPKIPIRLKFVPRSD